MHVQPAAKPSKPHVASDHPGRGTLADAVTPGTTTAGLGDQGPGSLLTNLVLQKLISEGNWPAVASSGSWGWAGGTSEEPVTPQLGGRGRGSLLEVSGQPSTTPQRTGPGPDTSMPHQTHPGS